MSIMVFTFRFMFASSYKFGVQARDAWIVAGIGRIVSDGFVSEHRGHVITGLSSLSLLTSFLAPLPEGRRPPISILLCPRADLRARNLSDPDPIMAEVFGQVKLLQSVVSGQ
jgi:hypothetical protein